MAEVAATQFTCGGCGKHYTWKKELAGKKAKCKCGTVMMVPASPPRAPEPQQDDLYDLAPDANEDAVKMAFAAARRAASEEEAEAPVRPARSAAAPVTRAPTSPALAYQRGQTQREKERFGDKTLLDMPRDVYVPVALLVLGMAMYVGYYAIRYQLTGTGIIFTSFGVGTMIAFKAALLIGFAFAVAGPLGVSFGGVWTAILKLAAIAIFTDGVTTWVDAGIARASGGVGGGGFMGWGMISFPVALGLYWGLLIYLFSMDSGDSWLVVMLLAVFDYIVRLAIMLLLLNWVLGLGGVTGAAVPTIGGGGGASKTTLDPNADRIAELKEFKLLLEARQYIAGGRQAALSKPVESWYAAGATNVWFEVSRDINQKTTAEGVIVELPKDKEKRAKCFEIYKAYLEEQDLSDDPEDLLDDGRTYLIVPIH